jgi:hypothetical protein
MIGAPAKADERAQIERRVAKRRCGVAPDPEVERPPQRNVMHRGELHALKVIVSTQRRAEDSHNRLGERAASRREDVVSRVIREGGCQSRYC